MPGQSVRPPNTSEFIVLTAALAILAGLISILAGFLKLGRVAEFFSESVMVGFISGLALVIMIKQVPKLLGIEGGEGNFWERLIEIIKHLPETSVPTLITGLLCLALLIALEHYFHKIRLRWWPCSPASSFRPSSDWKPAAWK